MADKPQADKAKAEKKEQPQAAAAPAQAPAAQASQQVQLDDSSVSSCYANFCQNEIFHKRYILWQCRISNIS